MPERRVRRDRDGDGRVDSRQLLDRDRVGDRVAAGAAVLLGDWKPHQAKLGELGDQLGRKAPFEIELRRHGCHALPRERPHGVADQLLLCREVEVHAPRILEVKWPTLRPRSGRLQVLLLYRAHYKAAR